jgi:hypothetical protein
VTTATAATYNAGDETDRRSVRSSCLRLPSRGLWRFARPADRSPWLPLQAAPLAVEDRRARRQAPRRPRSPRRDFVHVVEAEGRGRDLRAVHDPASRCLQGSLLPVAVQAARHVPPARHLVANAPRPVSHALPANRRESGPCDCAAF